MTEPNTYPYSPGLDKVPCAKSKICFIDGQNGVLSYRGYSIEELAKHSNFIETTYLLLKGKLPTQSELKAFRDDFRVHRRLKFRIIDLMKCLPESGHPMEALDTSVAAIGMFYPGKHVENADDRYWACIRLIAKLPTIVAAFHRMRFGDDAILPLDELDHSTNFLYMLSGKKPDPFVSNLLNVCLVLHAEHSMNASTFTARVVGSSLADPFAVVSSAVGTLSGPLHGGANEKVLHMLRDIGSVANVRSWVEDSLQNKRKIFGFGHREYKVKDPRAKVLQKLCLQLFERFGTTPLYDVALELEKVMEEKVGHKGVYPNVDFYSGIVYDKMGIPTELFTPIFAIARVSGWLAHWLEQLEGNRIFRPSQIYDGENTRSYQGIDKR